MEFIKTRCRKCGYELTIPDSTTSVICGSCGEINHFSRLTTLLRKHSNPDFEIKWGDKISGYPESSEGSVKNGLPDIPNQKEIPDYEDDEDLPEQGSAAKLMTLIFIIAPFIALAVEHFKLPSYVALIAIASVIFLIFLLKKRS
ncbi:MAG TPA: hypothetical protein P5120_09280 [Spirochaetota bacterium]|nr:hypothetical protein [Spirochaetota bacterium]HPF06756.1 hypothetical protein [Spirochaetota bacterium]HPJ41724.1 hypothetical protein [Spirochaetota bacterium]HPR36634.1 hypothetical protein [Spirochaetota bacterium]HRX47699.1 hypothetical protein [Spirochaetota bacterium]